MAHRFLSIAIVVVVAAFGCASDPLQYVSQPDPPSQPPEPEEQENEAPFDPQTTPTEPDDPEPDETVDPPPPPPDPEDPVPENNPPVAVAALDAAWQAVVAAPGDAVGLDGSGSSDPDGDALVFAWSLTSTPAGSASAVSPSDSVQPALPVDAEGNYVVELTVTDPGGLSDTDTLTITALAPYVDAPFAVEVEDYWVTTSSCYSASPVLSGSLTVDRQDPSLVFHFASSTFAGTIQPSGQFAVELAQEFDYTDGCRWASLDRIEGTFSTPDAFEADHRYEEWPISGQGCDSACVITSHLIGSRTTP